MIGKISIPLNLGLVIFGGEEAEGADFAELGTFEGFATFRGCYCCELLAATIF